VTRVLITGAASMSARHLVKVLSAAGQAATLTGADRDPRGVEGIPALALDLTDPAAVREAVRDTRPDLVYHLAGVLSPETHACYAVNLDGTRHLLEACAERGTGTRVLIVSSAAVYGLTEPGESPLSESTPFRPATAYGASKAAAELLALSMHRRGLVRVAVARPFNLVGPGLRAGFAASDFMLQALAIRDGRGSGPLRVGALEPRRDFVDVRDAVRAYRDLAENDEAYGRAFNVATGRPVAIRDLLDRVLEAAGVRPEIVSDPGRRRIEVVEQVGDASALCRLTGWRPEIPLADSIRAMAEAA
jgi:GDP-4-dehydro-6-deoxy-D-mannose reductase